MNVNVEVSIACVEAEASVVMVAAVVSLAWRTCRSVARGRLDPGAVGGAELVPLIEVAPVEVLPSLPSSTNHGLLVVHASDDEGERRERRAHTAASPGSDGTNTSGAGLDSRRRSQGSLADATRAGGGSTVRRRSNDPDRAEGHRLSWAT